MSETGPGPTGMKAAGTITQYRAAYISGEHLLTVVSNANGQRPIGIVQNDPIVDQPVEVAVYGHTARAEYGSGGATAGDKLRSNDSGQLVTDVEVLDGSAVDVHHIAIALEDGASGEIHDVLAIQPQIVGLQ